MSKKCELEQFIYSICIAALRGLEEFKSILLATPERVRKKPTIDSKIRGAMVSRDREETPGQVSRTRCSQSRILLLD